VKQIMGRAARLNKKQNNTLSTRLREFSKEINLDYYTKLLKRKFRNDQDFVQYEEPATTLADILTATRYSQNIQLLSDSSAYCLLNCAMEAHNDPNFPVYAVTKELIEMFLETDIPSNLQGIKSVFKSALFLFPKGFFKDKDNSIVNWVFVKDNGVLDYSNVIRSSIEVQKTLITLFPDVLTKEDIQNLVHNKDGKSFIGREIEWATNWRSKNSNGIYFSRFGIDNNGFIKIPGNHKTHDSIIKSIDADHDFTTVITKTIINCILYMQIYQESLSKVINSKAIGFSYVGQKQSIQQFKYLHLPQKVQVNKSSTKRTITHTEHASPITHWRRGHWRNQPCGEKLQDSKIIWIQPTLINPTQE
jgi:hypothetical protein